MKRIYWKSILLIVVLTALAACQAAPNPAPVLTQPPQPSPAPVTPTPLIETEAAPTTTPEPTATPIPVYGPEEYPAGINPLTGLQVSDPAVLERRPLVIKVSNESETVRPQSGLSFADHVWMYQMEGWGQTRFTAIYYSQAPEFVGSVRSVRLIDTDHLIHMYDGLLVISGGSVGMGTIIRYADWNPRVFMDNGPWLERIPNIPYEGMTGYHSLFARPQNVWTEADRRGVNQRPSINGLVFSAAVPEGGIPTSEAMINYPGKGALQRWQYDPATGRWLSLMTMENAAEPKEIADLDYITGQQLAFDNVVFLFAEFYLADFIEDMPNQLLSIGPILSGEGDAWLMRDGQRYAVRWQSDGTQMLRFYDSAGNPIAFKPGTTWFNVASVREDQYPPEVSFVPSE
jgi:hypothetical protein